MSGFPPPNPPNQHLDNLFVSPFSLEENYEEEKTQPAAPPSERGPEGQSEQSASTASRPSSPRLTSRPSQTALNVQQTDASALAQVGQQQGHTAPVVTPRTIGNSVPPASSAPTDPPPPLPQLKRGQGISQGIGDDPSAGRLTTTLLSSASSVTTRAVTTTLGRTPPTVTTTTTTTDSSPVGADTAEVKKAGTTHDYRLPELAGIKGKRLITHAQLAKQLVQAESRGYEKPLKQGSVDAILRGKVWLKVQTDPEGKSVPQSDEENAISQFSEPFMTHYFDTPEMNANLDQVTKGYEKQAGAVKTLYDQLGANNFNKNDDAANLMRPVIAPVTDYIFGKDNSIQTSKMPVPVLAAMLALDEEVKVWYEKNGGDNPDELKRARKNALTGIFGIRSFIPGYAVALSKDKTVAEGFYRPLYGFLIGYLNKGYDQFLDSVLNCSDEERKRIKREAAIVESRRVLPASERERLDQTKERFQSRKPSSLLVRLKDAVGSGLNPSNKNEITSPRRGLQRRETHSEKTQSAKDHGPQSSRAMGDSKKTLGAENNDIRKKKTERNRQAVLHEYLKTLDLNSIKGMTELGDILRGFNQKVVNASREEYKNFENNPDRFFHGFLQNLINQIQTRGAVPSPALQKYYIDLSDSLGIDDSV